MKTKCEGYRRYGGAFSFGPVVWEQCKKKAIVELIVVQGKKQITFPACMTCWDEAISNDIRIIKAKPIKK